MKYLIERGVDGNIKDEAGKTALNFGKIIRFDHLCLLFLYLLASSDGHLKQCNILQQKDLMEISKLSWYQLPFILENITF